MTPRVPCISECTTTAPNGDCDCVTCETVRLVISQSARIAALKEALRCCLAWMDDREPWSATDPLINIRRAARAALADVSTTP